MSSWLVVAKFCEVADGGSLRCSYFIAPRQPGINIVRADQLSYRKRLQLKEKKKLGKDRIIVLRGGMHVASHRLQDNQPSEAARRVICPPAIKCGNNPAI